MSDELTPEELFNQFMEQQTFSQNNLPPNIPTPQHGNMAGSVQENAMIQNLSTQTIDPNKNAIKPSTGECHECGTFHPPLRPGEKCPMAPVAGKSNTEQTSDTPIVDVNKYLVIMKNVIVSNAQKKEIKDIDKLFQQVILKITEFIEGYKEDEKT